MSRLLYEHSVSHQGHLIIPFVFGIVESQSIYTYRLLSELGHKGKFNQAENPSELYSGNLQHLIEIAKKHLDEHSDVVSRYDYFKARYTYNNHLIIIYQQGSKCFYDHYLPEKLNNIAAPKIFSSATDCISWVKQGIERNYSNPK